MERRSPWRRAYRRQRSLAWLVLGATLLVTGACAGFAGLFGGRRLG